MLNRLLLYVHDLDEVAEFYVRQFLLFEGCRPCALFQSHAIGRSADNIITLRGWHGHRAKGHSATGNCCSPYERRGFQNISVGILQVSVRNSATMLLF